MLITIAASAGLMLIGEMGDRSQLMALTLATRYRVRTVLLGGLITVVGLNLLGALAGEGLSRLLPEDMIRILAGLLFLAFSVITFVGAFRYEAEVVEDEEIPHNINAVLTTAGAIALAEIGDKSMLTTLTLATQYSWLAVWIGTTIGMFGAIAIGVLVGHTISRIVPVRKIQFFTAGLLLAIGLLILLS